MIDHRLERAGLGKQMARSRNDLQRLGSSQPRQRLLIELDDAEIGAADDQQRRRLHCVERISSEVRAPTARDHCTDTARKFCRRDKRRRRSGTGAEQSKRKLGDRRLAIKPMDGIDEPVRQQRDVEHIGPISLFCRGQTDRTTGSRCPACSRRWRRPYCAG